MTEVERGYIHLPMADWCGDEFCAQLTSERLVTRWKSGLPVTVWQKIRPATGARPERLRARRAALAQCGPWGGARAPDGHDATEAAGDGCAPSVGKGPWLPKRRRAVGCASENDLYLVGICLW